jgi:hypothetical protein
VPFDHFGQCINHDKRSHIRIFQHGLRGVTEPEAADDHVEVRSRQRRQSQPRQLDLGNSELARHQEFIAEFYLVDVEAGAERPSPPQAEHADRRRAKIQLFKIDAHALIALTAPTAPSGRDFATVPKTVIASVAKQSILVSLLGGLLRCARNDDVSPVSIRCISNRTPSNSIAARLPRPGANE